MKKFTTGLIAGGVIGAVGLSYALSDRRMRKKIKKGSKMAANKVGDVIENITESF